MYPVLSTLRGSDLNHTGCIWLHQLDLVSSFDFGFSGVQNVVGSRCALSVTRALSCACPDDTPALQILRGDFDCCAISLFSPVVWANV